MRAAKVYRNSLLVGILTEDDNKQYRFEYDAQYFSNNVYPSVSLTMPKSQKIYESPFLFPFFFNMLAEGENKKLQTRHLQVDEADYFGLLLATSSADAIGAIFVEKLAAYD